MPRHCFSIRAPSVREHHRDHRSVVTNESRSRSDDRTVAHTTAAVLSPAGWLTTGRTFLSILTSTWGGESVRACSLPSRSGRCSGRPRGYKLSTWIHVPAGGFPWATFWTNVSGSLVLGALLWVLIERYPPSQYVRAFVGTGVLGVYTTFSTFSVETDVLVKDGHAGLARPTSSPASSSGSRRRGSASSPRTRKVARA